MKILVADDDAVLRKLLKGVLTKAQYEVELVSDGDAAWRLLEKPDGPPLAILDWMMPGMSGLEICAKLRQSDLRSRPYIIILSARREKDDIIAGLDAGADDYLTKPFHPAEMQARLRVAERIIGYQREMQQHIRDLELLLRRHNLLSEIFGKQVGGSDGGQFSAAAMALTPGAVTSFNHRIVVLLPPQEVERLIAKALDEMGLTALAAVDLEATPMAVQPFFTAWTPLVFSHDGVWVDIRIEVDRASAVAMFEALVKRHPSSDHELTDMLAETLNLVQTTFKATFTEHEVDVLTPVLPRAIKAEALQDFPLSSPAQRQHVFTMTDPAATVQFTFSMQPAVPVKKEIKHLVPLDTLAETLFSPDSAGVPLLNRGIMLNPRYIHKLGEVIHSDTTGLTALVVEPSRLMRFFCGG